MSDVSFGGVLHSFPNGDTTHLWVDPYPARSIFESAKRNDLHAAMEGESYSLRGGDLITIFNDVASGEILWEGDFQLRNNTTNLTLAGNKAFYGLLEGAPFEQWYKMFYFNLPAVLQQNGQRYSGALKWFYETGMEGLDWTFSPYRDQDDMPKMLLPEDGGYLTVYRTVDDGGVSLRDELLDPRAADGHGRTPGDLLRPYAADYRPVVVTPRGACS